jgi:hypothetical protein
MKLQIWINRILLSLFVLLSGLSIAGKLAFGHGIGDLYYYLLLWLTTLVFAILFFLKKKNSQTVSLIITIVFGCILLLLVYSMTLGRGTEYRWNGNILYSKT